MKSITLTEFRFTAASRMEMKTGLLGWIGFTINATLRVDGTTLRKTADGRLTLSFPKKTARDGRKHSIIWPISETARQDMESQVFEALNLGAGRPS
ncbi:MAG: hypothetical protein HQ519_07955 [Planctomycetes bacterium]|nr:hypothetical protein [Planctomycetota bacterium]